MSNNTITICLSCDLNYLRYACVSIASVAHNTSSKVKFYILHTEISKETQGIVKTWLHTEFPHCSLDFLDIGSQLGQIHVKKVRHFNALVFGRYFIPDLLPQLNKVIYIDSDTIVLNDISKLYDTDLEGSSLGAVYEYWLENNDWGGKIKNDLEYLNLSPKHRYFSSGVLLMDCKKWRCDKITERLLELYTQYTQYTQYPDQDPLNKLFENNYKELDAEFNTTEQTIYSWQQKSDQDLLYLKNNIVVRHFAGDNKPWNQVYLYSDIHNQDCSDNFNDWWFYAAMTPFCSALENNFLEKQMLDFREYELPRLTKVEQSYVVQNEKQKISFKLFSKIPLLTIKKRKDKVVYRLFNLFPLLSVVRKEK